MIQVIKSKFEEEIVFVVSTLMAVITSFLVKPSIDAVDLKVIFSLFNLMLISLAFEKYHLLDGIAVYILSMVRSEKSIGLVMIFTTAGLGMLMTNDVALLTVVPITMTIARKAGFDPFKVVVLETAAANIGSSFTPFGNPQNLYLYNYFQMDTKEFFLIITPFVIAGMILLILINMRNSDKLMDVKLNKVHLKQVRKIAYYAVLFILVILSVLRQLDYKIVTLVVMVSVIILDRKLVKKVDYFLLGTFVSFFIFIDNVTRLEMVNIFARNLLDSPLKVFSVSALLSQIISNVPSAILISGFTPFYRELFLGVSVGGLGTLVASLANLISYKIYCKSFPRKQYKIYFNKLNAALLIILSAFVIIFRQIQ
ncbi:anion transporter [Tissierella creatinini]|nr:anion transporter [Tissierella creatinini]TJX61852.1 anion transporter [Soehngenia saccharolytica]